MRKLLSSVLESRRTLIVQGDDVCAWVAKQSGGEYFGGGVGFGIEKEGRIVCGVLFENYTAQSLQIHVALEPGQRMSKEWLKALFGYAFNFAKVKKIVGVIDSENSACLKFTRHIGFIDEAIIKDAGPKGDYLILTMTRDQCRFLG